jgi:iron(III) transport system substrate-binding protein
MKLVKLTFLLVLLVALTLSACASNPGAITDPASSITPDPQPDPESDGERVSPVGAGDASLVIYSGRSESLVGPLIDRFTEATGIEVSVRWGKTAELAATLLEEGDNSRADLFYAQDPGGLSVVDPLFDLLPEDILNQVDARFRDPESRWIGVSGRARVVVYNTQTLPEAELPEDIWDFTDPKWDGRLGWAPTNTSFQTMVTGMRATWGEGKTRQWLSGILQNNPVVYDNNTSIVAGVGAGEVEVGFVNHYYLFRFLEEEGEDFPARNHFLPGDGPGSIVMVSGAGVLQTSANKESAHRFLRFLLSPEAQRYFASETYEYPLVPGIPPRGDLPPLTEISSPEIDLTNLSDLQGTVALLRETGALP